MTFSVVPETGLLARHIASANFDAMPDKDVEAAKIFIPAGLAVTLAGSREQAFHTVTVYTQEMGGNPLCSVLRKGLNTSPPMAALANGVTGHVLDYEVMWHPATRATSPTLLGILAMADIRQSTGREMIEH